MKSKWLFPNRFKLVGWLLFVPALLAGVASTFWNYEPELLDFQIPAFLNGELLGGQVEWVVWVDNNLLNELAGIGIILGGLLVGFSRLAQEDEYISKIRLESLLWSFYVNYAIMLVAMLLFYDFSFLWVMIFNIFTPLLLFIILFHWRLGKATSSSAS